MDVCSIFQKEIVMKSGLMFSALMGVVLLGGCSGSRGRVDDYTMDEEAISVTEIADGVFIIAPTKEPAISAVNAARKATTRKLKRWVEESDYPILSVRSYSGRWPYFRVIVQKPPKLLVKK